MTLPQHLLYAKGGVIHIDVATLPAAATVEIRDASDGTRMAHAEATISTINAALAANVSAGDMSVSVDSNTGLSAGKTFWLRDDPEELLCRSVEGTTIRLRRPALYDHVNAARVEGARVQCNVAAAYANVLWWDGRAEWNIDGATHYTSVECTKYPITRLASAQDLFDLEPKLFDVIDRETDVERWLDNAHEMVMGEISKTAPDQRARVFTGSMEFKSVTAAAALYLHYMRRGSDMRETWWSEFERRLGSVVTTTPRDPNQDGTIELGGRISLGTVPLRRS